MKCVHYYMHPTSPYTAPKEFSASDIDCSPLEGELVRLTTRRLFFNRYTLVLTGQIDDNDAPFPIRQKRTCRRPLTCLGAT